MDTELLTERERNIAERWGVCPDAPGKSDVDYLLETVAKLREALTELLKNESCTCYAMTGEQCARCQLAVMEAQGALAPPTTEGGRG